MVSWVAGTGLLQCAGTHLKCTFCSMTPDRLLWTSLTTSRWLSGSPTCFSPAAAPVHIYKGHREGVKALVSGKQVAIARILLAQQQPDLLQHRSGACAHS